MSKRNPIIWVLGSKNENADKSIQWTESFPNFTDPDIIIVNLNSLSKDVRKSIPEMEYFYAKSEIMGRFVNGGTLFITARHPERVSYILGALFPCTKT